MALEVKEGLTTETRRFERIFMPSDQLVEVGRSEESVTGDFNHIMFGFCDLSLPRVGHLHLAFCRPI